MSWLYSRALVEAYSEDISSGGAPSAQSSKTPTPLAYCAPDKMTAFWRLSRSGTTFAPLTDGLGEAVLMWCLEAFPAKTSALQAKEPESTENEADSGEKWLASFAKFDRASCSWKTRQCSLVAGSELYSETWPAYGMMRNGACWELPTLKRHTGEIAFGFWPTPTAGDAKGSGSRNTVTSKAHAGVSLTDAVRGDGGTGRASRNMWPTPTAKANMLAPSMQKWPAHRNLFPTPTAHNAKEGASLAEYGRNTPTLACHAGGPLNPTWVEWLMGWPLGWTDLEPLEMGKFRQWLHSHGSY